MKLSKEDQGSPPPNKDEESNLAALSGCLRTPPRSILLHRDKNRGFGFTLRHFILYPPDTLKALRLQEAANEGDDNEDKSPPLECQQWQQRQEEDAMDTIFVREVKEGSSAHQAGLVTGDRILTINGEPLVGKTYPQVIELIQNSGETLHLLVVPKEDDILQLYFASSAYHPVERRPVTSDPGTLQGTLSRLLYDMWYNHHPSAMDPEGAGSTSKKPGSLATFISRTMKAFITHPPDFRMLSSSISSTFPSEKRHSAVATTSHNSRGTPPEQSISSPQASFCDSRKGSTDLRAALSHQRREFFCGSSAGKPEGDGSQRNSYLEEEEDPDQVHNSLRLVAQRLKEFESGTLQAKSLERTKFYRSEIAQMAGQSPTRIVSKRAAHFESLSPPPIPATAQFKPLSTKEQPTSLWQERISERTPLPSSTLCNSHHQTSPVALSKPNGYHPLSIAAETNGVVLRRKQPSSSTSGTNGEGQPEETGVARRESYLRATAECDFSEEEEDHITEDASSSLPPSSNHKLQKLKSFFGEKTPRIRHAIELPAPAEPLSPISKQGWLVCKPIAVDGKRASDRSWRPVWSVLQKETLFLLKEKRDSPLDESITCGDEEHIVHLSTAIASVAQDYTKRKHVLRLRLAGGTEYLLQAESRAIMMDWLYSLHANTNAANSIPNQRGITGSWPLANSVLEKAAAYEQNIQPPAPPQTTQSTTSTTHTLTKKLPFRHHHHHHQQRSPSHHHSPSAPLKSRRASHGDELALPKLWRGKVQQGWRRLHEAAHPVLPPPPGCSIGVRLEDCPVSDAIPGVPLLVELCTHAVEEGGGLTTVGIYRVPGNSAAVAQLSELASAGRNASTPSLASSLKQDARWADVHVVSSLLKAFFRKLPDPLVPAHLYQRFIAASKMADPVDRLTSLRKLIIQLPNAHLQTLKFLIKHLRRVVDNSKINKMEARNLAIVFGPTLVRSADGNMVTMVTDMSHQCYIIETMIVYADWLFGDAPLSSLLHLDTGTIANSLSSSSSALLSSLNKMKNGTSSTEGSISSSDGRSRKLWKKPSPSAPSSDDSSSQEFQAYQEKDQEEKEGPSSKSNGDDVGRGSNGQTLMSSWPGSLSQSSASSTQEERVRNFEAETRAMLQQRQWVGTGRGRQQHGGSRPVGWEQLEREWQKAKKELEQEDISSLDIPPIPLVLGRTFSHDNLEATSKRLMSEESSPQQHLSRPASLEGCCPTSSRRGSGQRTAIATTAWQSQSLEVEATIVHTTSSPATTMTTSPQHTASARFTLPPPPISPSPPQASTESIQQRRHTIADPHSSSLLCGPSEHFLPIDDDDVALLDSPSDCSRAAADTT